MTANLAGKNQRELLDRITHEISLSLQDPARVEYANRGIIQSLLRHMDIDQDEHSPEIPLPDQSAEDEKKARLMRNYLGLLTIFRALEQTEYYFRTYPFRNENVSKTEHLRNCCEMFFDRVSQFRDRLKNITKLIQSINDTKDERFGRLIKSFDRSFDWEIRQRNATHHSRRFEDGAIGQLSLIDLMRFNDELRNALPNATAIYRQETKTWVKRIRLRAGLLDRVIDLVAGFILELSIFPESNEIS